MRQYKFRGKSMETGKWVFGYLVSGGLFGGNVDQCWIFSSDFRFHQVFPETVGISLCLPDKNDIEIYEGDIVEGHMGWLKGDGYLRKGYPTKIRQRLEVVFNKKGWEAGFDLLHIGYHPDDVAARQDYFYRNILYSLQEDRECELRDNQVVWLGKCTTLEVVGNKFDNPELYNL